ncbi:MAG: MoaD/ThiS family protein [Gemmatimonadaceae bacterium]|nr:MoaD/ThiS family protein [Gemmatimonadaceae bacterium]
MHIEVLLFASYAEALGAPRVRLSLREGATVADVLAALRSRSAAGSLPPALVAINSEYAASGQVIRESDEVAVIPPVAGG